MTKKINHVVQVQQNALWSIHARFPESQTDAAIKEGKQLDKLSAIDLVKVINEVYDPDREKHG
jgi:hypothetical protein